MFTSAFRNWFEMNDPYGLQRMALPKAIFVATIATYVYWLFQPVSIQSFFAAFFVVAFYESPALHSFAEKERLLIFMAIVLVVISVAFYLVYPFKGTFFFFSILVLALTYFSVLKNFYALKNLTMLLIVNGAVILSTEPQANFQVAYNISSAIILAMTTTFIALKFYPNRYLAVWNKAMQKFLFCLIKDMDAALNKLPYSSAEEVVHLDMARNYRHLIPQKFMFSAYHFSVNLRRIEHCLDSIYYEQKNEAFWLAIKEHLETLEKKMNTYISSELPHMPLEPQTKLQHYTVNCLRQVFIHWNKLCYLQQK